MSERAFSPHIQMAKGSLRDDMIMPMDVAYRNIHAHITNALGMIEVSDAVRGKLPAIDDAFRAYATSKEKTPFGLGVTIETAAAKEQLLKALDTIHDEMAKCPPSRMCTILGMH